MFRISLSILLPAVMATGCWSDGESANGDPMCGLLHCTDQLTLDIERRDEHPLAPGDYHIEVTTGTDTVYKIDCMLEASSSLSCDGDTAALSTSVTPTGTRMTLRLDETPRQIFVTVAYDGREVGTAALAPEYDLLSEDPTCDELCRQGTTRLEIAP